MKKKYHLGDVLSITSGGILVSLRGLNGLYDILSFMTGEKIATHQIPRAIDDCRSYLIRQYPWLDSPAITVMAFGELRLMLETVVKEEEKRKLVIGWLSKIASGRYGITCPGLDEEMMLPILPLVNQFPDTDPMEEVERMVGPDTVIIPVEFPPEES